MKFFSNLLKHGRFITIVLVTALLVCGISLGLKFWMISLKSPEVSIASIPASNSFISPSPIANPGDTLRSQPQNLSSNKIPRKLLQSMPQANAKTSAQLKSYFGHLPYQEDDPSRLVVVGRFVRETYERTEQLDWEATQAFQQMVAAAKADEIFLMPISGFRSIADQEALFSKQIQRQGSEQAAARLSAPPGYSEHHTGYAIDIGDVQQPDTDLKETFEATDVYRWLEANSHKYGFEESFAKHNKQGVSFEPWHWRFTLSARAANAFRKGATEKLTSSAIIR